MKSDEFSDDDTLEEDVLVVALKKLQTALEAKLSKKYSIPIAEFRKTIVARLRNEELDEDEDIMQWQSITEALDDSEHDSERIAKYPLTIKVFVE